MFSTSQQYPVAHLFSLASMHASPLPSNAGVRVQQYDTGQDHTVCQDVEDPAAARKHQCSIHLTSACIKLWRTNMNLIYRTTHLSCKRRHAVKICPAEVATPHIKLTLPPYLASLRISPVKSTARTVVKMIRTK